MPKLFKAKLVDCGRNGTRDIARRTLVCTYHGTAFSSEREGDELKIYMVSDDMLQTGTVGDYATRANTGGPGGWKAHIDDIHGKLGDCAKNLKDHAGTLKDHDARIGELERDPSGGRNTVSDKKDGSKSRSGAMSAARMQAQIEAHRTVRNEQ